MKRFTSSIGSSLLLIFTAAAAVSGQSYVQELSLAAGGTVEVINLSGRVYVEAAASENGDRLSLSAGSATGMVTESEVKIDSNGGRVRVEAAPNSARKRIDISLKVPERTRLKIRTADGEVRVSGNLESVVAETETGTVAADVPTIDLRYNFQWTAARPRYVADFELERVKEKSGGRFEIKGKHKSDEPAVDESAEPGGNGLTDNGSKREKSDQKARSVELSFTTDRGIILLNVQPNEVMSDLRERPLTEAAKAIIRSGDKVLMEAIRRATPKYFGDYSKTLPPVEREPLLGERRRTAETEVPTVKTALVSVTDLNNRAVAGLKAADFVVTESGDRRQVISVDQVSAPVNLVLLLDVSGSVDNYVDFIRKAARSFVNTVDVNDRISLILFNDDVKELSGFTLDKAKLSVSLDTFDAGGPTAYYDAIAFTLADVLRPFRGERTAIVVLTDGDDNRSFLPFDSLAGAIEESGALIYPLYVPSSLVAAAAANPEATVDPVRSRYTGLSQKAQGEGEKLAKISGGVYYPISRISDIQKAYDDIVVQLRTAYNVTFRSSTAADPNNKPSPRLKIRVNRQNAYATVSRVTANDQLR